MNWEDKFEKMYDEEGEPEVQLERDIHFGFYYCPDCGLPLRYIPDCYICDTEWVHGTLKGCGYTITRRKIENEG